MQSAHSSKVAIRKRMQKIEDNINKNNSIKINLWSDSISERKNRHKLEKLFKNGKLENEIDFLNISAYLVVILWIIISAIFFIKNILIFL